MPAAVPGICAHSHEHEIRCEIGGHEILYENGVRNFSHEILYENGVGNVK